jgi:hypothetical protein
MGQMNEISVIDRSISEPVRIPAAKLGRKCEFLISCYIVDTT